MSLDVVEHKDSSSSTDLSSGAIKRALLDYTNNHWAFRYSIPLFAGSLVYGGVFGFTYPIFLASLATSFLGVGSWIYNFFINGDKFEKNYVKALRTQLVEKSNRKKISLKEDLTKFKLDRGYRQLVQFDKKFENFADVLKSKFNTSQLTYSRYLAIGQEVYLSGIDNLFEIILALKTINTIDTGYIKKRLKELEQENLNNKIYQKEFKALSRSMKSHSDQKTRIEELLAENEAALSKFDETIIAISQISKIKDRSSKVSMENAMKELQELIHRSKYYSN